MKKELSTTCTLTAIIAASAEGSIIAVTAPADAHIFLGFGDSPTFYSWDINRDGNADFTLSATGVNDPLVPAFGSFIWGAAIGTNFTNAILTAQTAGNAANIMNLPSGQLVGSNSFTLPGNGFTYSVQWPVVSIQTHKAFIKYPAIGTTAPIATTTLAVNAATTGFLFGKQVDFLVGFRFRDHGTGNTTHYGWASITATGKDFYDNGDNTDDAHVTINNWAYNSTPNEPINVGQVPEPAIVAPGLGLLAIGAAGLRRWRQNRART